MAPAKLSVTLSDYFLNENSSAPSQVTLGDLFTIAGDRTFYFLFLLLALPSALPLPAPGYATPFGLVIFLLAVQWMTGSHQPWIPRAWREKGINRQQVEKIVKAGLPWLRRIEALSRPRLHWVCRPGPSHWLIGLAIVLMSISMMIIIPGTNTLPAMGIFVVSFGLFDDDGAIVLGGLTLCIMGACLTTFILIFGYEAVRLGIKTVLGFF
ncbi:MAG: exopolysaccharide biosynthesis protein [Prochlorotrichaceae cyanobacterium]|jgi:hypothetical protein